MLDVEEFIFLVVAEPEKWNNNIYNGTKVQWPWFPRDELLAALIPKGLPQPQLELMLDGHNKLAKIQNVDFKQVSLQKSSVPWDFMGSHHLVR